MARSRGTHQHNGMGMGDRETWQRVHQDPGRSGFLCSGVLVFGVRAKTREKKKAKTAVLLKGPSSSLSSHRPWTSRSHWQQ